MGAILNVETYQQFCPLPRVLRFQNEILKTPFLVFITIFKKLFIFSQRIIVLQCCVGFCHDSCLSTRINIFHRNIYVLSILNLPPCLACHRALDLSSLSHTANFHWLSNFTLLPCMTFHF